MLLAFLGFVVLLAGVVAYAADTIARRVGRRHLRLFGLRPKTTALIVAVASGMGISLASVLAFAFVNRQAIYNITQADKLRLELRDLRAGVAATRAQLKSVQDQRDSALAEAAVLRSERNQAVLDRDQADREAGQSADLLARARQNYQGLFNQAEALSEQVQDMAAKRDQLQATAQASQQDLSRTRAEAAALAATARSSQQDLSRTQAEAEALAARVQAAQTQVQALTASRTALSSQVQAAQTQVKALTASRTALAARVQEAEAQLSAAGERLSAATARAGDASARAQNAEARLARVQGKLASLSDSVGTLQSSVNALQANVNNLQSTRSTLQGQRDALSRELNSLKAVRDSLQRDNTTLQQGLEAAVAERDRLQADVQSVTSELSATRSGGLVYRRGDTVSSSIVASVLNLPDALRQAESSALSRGARGNPAAYLPGALEDQLQTKLRAMNTTALVTCRAASNTASGYPVELSCDAVPNALLYHRGDVIRSVQITLAGNSDALRVQLLDLESAVLHDLSMRGVPPERVTDGGLSTSELFDLLSQLRGRPVGGMATVSIAAGSDVRPGSPVDLYATVK